ncbi:MAG: TetR/AcrR family transcriptional regulator [Acidimicrobiales bacterium]
MQAARALIVEVGIRGLTMRRLSAKLGVALGATYHHVPTKRDVLLLVAHDLYQDIPIPSVGSWDERVKQIMLSVADIVATYPGLSDFMISNAPEAVPRDLDKAFVGIVRDAGFSDEGVDAVKSALFFYVTGMSAGGFATATMFGGFDVRRLFEDGLDLLLAGARSRLQADRRLR